MGTHGTPLPSEIQVLGTTYTVVIEPLSECHGQTDYAHRRISINMDDPDDIRLETFYHEVVHAMLGHTGLDYTLTARQNELFAQMLGIAMRSVVASVNGTLPV